MERGRVKGRGPRLRGVRLALAIILSLLSIVGAFFGYLGYFGGPVLTMLPATGRPIPARSHLAAVYFSGDMGFTMGLAPRVASRLTAAGIPVIGVNSLTFFRHERTPAEVGALVSDVTRRALALGNANRVILIGQSFGADTLHVGLARMSPDLRSKIRMVALVVPTDTILFRASPSELLSWNEREIPALPSARQLDWVPVTCIHGTLETESLCPIWTQANVHRVALPGGHPLHGDDGAVYAVLSRAIDASVSGNPAKTGS